MLMVTGLLMLPPWFCIETRGSSGHQTPLTNPILVDKEDTPSPIRKTNKQLPDHPSHAKGWGQNQLIPFPLLEVQYDDANFLEFLVGMYTCPPFYSIFLWKYKSEKNNLNLILDFFIKKMELGW